MCWCARPAPAGETVACQLHPDGGCASIKEPTVASICGEGNPECPRYQTVDSYYSQVGAGPNKRLCCVWAAAVAGSNRGVALQEHVLCVGMCQK